MDGVDEGVEKKSECGPPKEVEWAQPYPDDSGTEYAVRYHHVWSTGESIEFVSMGSSAEFPIDRLDWLIACLVKTKEMLAGS